MRCQGFGGEEIGGREAYHCEIGLGGEGGVVEARRSKCVVMEAVWMGTVGEEDTE